MPPTAHPVTAAPSLRSLRHWAIAIIQSLLCTALGLLLFLVTFGALLEEFADEPPAGLLAMYGIDALVGAVAALAVGLLRFVPPGRWHSVLHLLVAAAGGISSWALPAAVIALYRLGRRRQLGVEIAAVVLVTAVSMTSLLLDTRIRGEQPGPLELSALGIMVALTLVPLLVGHVAGTRSELLGSLRERAASADREREAAQRERTAAEREAAALVRERDAEEARVRAEERSALARDMHDSISHHLATIALHAGAMSYREDLPAEELRRSAATVREAAQQANRELRTVLMSLRTTDGDAPLATAPTLAAIVERCREEGQDVELSWHGVTAEELEGAGRSTVVTLARILTELTANAAKHAPGAPLRLTLTRAGAGDTVRLRARNPMPTGSVAAPTSTGHGLLGVQERARLLGGDAEHRIHEEHFEVEAWMPW